MKDNLFNPKRQRFTRNWQRGCFAVALSLVCAARAHGPGYLAVIGPSEFRMATPPPPATNHFVPPPPKPEPAISPISVQKAEAATNSPDANPANTNNISTNGTVMSATSGAPEQAAPEAVVSPQMLLRFFNGGTNGGGASVVAPMEVAPPRPAAAPQSSATYISP